MTGRSVRNIPVLTGQSVWGASFEVVGEEYPRTYGVGRMSSSWATRMAGIPSYLRGEHCGGACEPVPKGIPPYLRGEHSLGLGARPGRGNTPVLTGGAGTGLADGCRQREYPCTYGASWDYERYEIASEGIPPYLRGELEPQIHSCRRRVYPRTYGASPFCRIDNIIHFRRDFPYVLEEISLLRIQLNDSGE